MANGMTVADVLERVRERRRSTRCPDCNAPVSIKGYRGEYRWSCLECDAIGFGYTTRDAARDGVRGR